MAVSNDQGTSSSISWLHQSVQENPEPVETTITGKIPVWIKGSFLRNGPGKFEVGKDSYNHFFDGLSLLTKFYIENGKVTYQSRFQRSDSYTKAMAQNRIVVSEFGTLAHPDPCLTFFGRFMAHFKAGEPTDNCSVNWMTLGDECYVLTETKNMRKIDPVTLATLDKVDISKVVAVNNATAHPHADNDGTVYNMGSRFGKRTTYNIIKIPPPDPGVVADPMSKASILCSIPSTNWYPSYFHSFGMSDNYIIFLEQPLSLNLRKIMLRGVLNSNSFEESLEFNGETPAWFHVVKRDTGELVSQKFTADAFFCFHHVNAYEDGDHLVVDICCYDDNDIIKTFYHKVFREGQQAVPSTAKRFVLPIGEAKQPGVNLNTLDYSTATSVLRDGGSIHCTPQVITKETLEFPRINYEKHNGKPYRYFYGVGRNLKLLMKVDTRTGLFQEWSEEGCHPSEPVFINSPESTGEDDGVVLCSVIDVREGNSSFLLVLDAHDFKEIARAEVGAEVYFGLHAMFLAN